MSSACYVYAIVGRHTSLPSLGAGNGLDELRLVRWRNLAAVTGPTASENASLTTDAVLHHEAVVEAVRQRVPALPVRFGTVFRDATSLASALAERYESLADDLERLGDKVELSVTVLWVAPPAADTTIAMSREKVAHEALGMGARYLRGRAFELRREEELRERANAVAYELDQAVGGLALERRLKLLPTPRIALRAAYLLDDVRVGAFRAAFDAIRQSRSDLRGLLTGPWPPYTFVRQRDAGGGLAAPSRLSIHDATAFRLDGRGARVDN